MILGKVRQTIYLSKLNQLEILKMYMNIESLPSCISCPWRIDNDPSLYIYQINNIVFYKDLATNERGDIKKLLCKTFNKSEEELIKDISNNKDLKYVNNTNVVKKHTKKDIKVKIRDWNKSDDDYWCKIGLSRDFLESMYVYPISFIFIYEGEKETIIKADKLSYVFIEAKDGITSYKIYQPLSKKSKWINGHDSSVLDLWFALPDKGENLIITSSRKDAMCIIKHCKIPSISMQSEGCIIKENVLNELKTRFKNIYVFFDNDLKSQENYGQLFASKLCKMYNLKNIVIPDFFQQKDPSDLIANFNTETLIKIVNNNVNRRIWNS